MITTFKHPSKLPVENYAIPLSRFTWDRESRSLSAYASDLDHQGPQQLYNDACDIGIAIHSEKTDVVEVFYFTGVDTDEEGEIQGWNFVPINKGCRVKRVLIIND